MKPLDGMAYDAYPTTAEEHKDPKLLGSGKPEVPGHAKGEKHYCYCQHYRNSNVLAYVPARSVATSTVYANHRLHRARFCSCGLAHMPWLYLSLLLSQTNIVVIALPM